MIYGVDPGFGGAVALYDPKTRFLEVHDMPVLADPAGKRSLNVGGLLSILEGEHGCVWLEKVAARPGQGVTSMFRFGECYGATTACIIAAGRELRDVTPSQWKKHFGLKGAKDAAINLAQKRFPEHRHYFLRKKDDGRAEAALIALYGAEVSA